MGSRKVEFNEAMREVQDKMATKKTTTKTKRTTGTKTTGKRPSGKTARAETFKVPRTAKQLAAGIRQRLKRSPSFWSEVQTAMRATTSPPRVAHVEPREATQH